MPQTGRGEPWDAKPLTKIGSIEITLNEVFRGSKNKDQGRLTQNIAAGERNSFETTTSLRTEPSFNERAQIIQGSERTNVAVVQN